jgi:hypothetical protein
VVILAFFAFQYARQTNFPVGDDPAIHITTVKTASYGEILRSNYPLPVTIFKVADQITQVDLPQLFVWTICTFLLLAAISLYFFVYTMTGNIPLAAAAAIFFVTARWVNDSIRMGVLAETFSWSILFLTLTALAKEKLVPTLILTAILVLSHPFAVLIYGLIAICFLGIALLGPSPKERLFARNLSLAYIGMAIVVGIAKPDLISKFLMFASTDPAGWGDRTLWDIISGDDLKRLFVPMLAVVGLFVGSQFWSRTLVKISFILLTIGLFMSLNYVLGMNFIPFRFYVYLEMGMAVFAALGLFSLIQELSIPIIPTALIVLIFSVLVAMPNVGVNDEIGIWQATNPDARAIMTPADRTAIAWIKENIPAGTPITAMRQQGLWLTAIGDQKNILYLDLPYNGNALRDYYATGATLPAKYIYYSVGQVPPDNISTEYREIYDEGGVRLWEKKI